MSTADEEAFLREMANVQVERLAVLLKSSGALNLTLVQCRDVASFMSVEAERLLWVISITDRDDP